MEFRGWGLAASGNAGDPWYQVRRPQGGGLARLTKVSRRTARETAIALPAIATPRILFQSPSACYNVVKQDGAANWRIGFRVQFMFPK